MGFKTEEAFEAAATAADENTSAVEKGAQALTEFRMTIEEQETELERLQEAYMGVALSMGNDSDEAIALKTEIDELSSVLEDNHKELKKLEEQAGKTGEEGNAMVKKIEQALTVAALAKLISEITESVIDMANAFSESESVIAKATGATGEQLDSLNASMLTVYSAIDDGDMTNTAGAIGEINTRLGLQGEALEHVAELFMVYSDNTNSNVVPAVQAITKVMKNWGVAVDDIDILLDKFTFAAQSSGASVDYLSEMVVSNKSMLQQMGYSLDESIALMAMFEYEGLNASSIMMGFRSAITNFSSEGKDASTAMQEVIEQIASMADESEATALAIETFGSRAGSELAYAIRSGKFEIEEWVSSMENAEGTLARTDEAADTLADKWTVAGNSIKTAFTSVISPAANTASTALAGFVQGVGDFLNEHPVVTTALTAIGVGFVALAGYIIVAKVAALASVPAFKAMAKAIWAAHGPIGLIVAGVAALVSGIVMLISWIGKQNEEFNSLTATSKQHYEQIEQLNSEYEETVALYGENSTQAQQLAADIAGLEAVYESTKMTLEEFVAQNDALIESHDALIQSYHSSMTEIDAEEKSTQALISKLDELSTNTERTEGEQLQMEAIVKKLNSLYPDLALSIDDTTNSLEQSVDAYRALAEAEAAEQRTLQQYESYVKLLSDRANLEAQINKAADERAAAEERYQNASVWDKIWNVGKVRSDVKDIVAEEERLQTSLDETNGLIAEHEQAFEAAAEAAQESAAYDEWAANVESAAADVETAIENVSEVWQQAYDSAYKSISGQLGLYNELKEDMEGNVNDLINIWNSHTDYLNHYSDNIASASEVFSTDLVNSLSDGSQESAAYLDSMVRKYDELVSAYGADSAEVQSYLDEVNNAFEERQAAMEEWSTTVADTSSEVAEALAEAQTAIDEFAQSLEISDEAAQYGGEAAQQYIASFSAYLADIQTAFSDAGGKVSELDKSLEAKGYGEDIGAKYAKGIESQLTAVTNAAKKLSSAVTSALSGTNISVTTSVGGYATGTQSAERGVKLVGEEGPELVFFEGGERVYNADETSRMLENAANRPIQTALPKSFETSKDAVGNDKTTLEKKIKLEIIGSGEIDVSGEYSKERIWSIVSPQLKQAIMSMLKQEVYEEGDLAYEF